MEPRDYFNNVVTAASQCVMHVRTDQLGNDTPCKEWDLRQLLNHMVYELVWLPDMLAGKTITEVGDKYDGDLLGEDVSAAWTKAVASAQTAILQADLETMVYLSTGEKPASEYVTEVATDLLIHTWDVGQSVQCSERLDEKLATIAYEYLAPRVKDWREAGLVGPEITAPDQATALHRLLCLSGRRPNVQD